MVSCFKRAKKVIFWRQKKLKKRHQHADFVVKLLLIIMITK